MAEDQQIDKKRTDILRKVYHCTKQKQRSFTVPPEYLEAARLVAEDSQKVPRVSLDDKPFRLDGTTFSW